MEESKLGPERGSNDRNQNNRLEAASRRQRTFQINLYIQGQDRNDQEVHQEGSDHRVTI